MVSKTLLAGTALAAAGANAAAIDPACTAFQGGLPSFPTQSASISSFCSSYFHISTRTTTTTTTVTNRATSTSNVQATTTTTPTSTVYSTTSTCYTSPTAGSVVRRTAEPQFPNPSSVASSISSAAASASSAAISTACSCAGVTVSPTATATATSTSTTYVATVTSTTGTSTVTASPVTVTSAATQTIPPSATHTAPAGTRFYDYDGYDFYGNDLASSYCGDNGSFNLPNGSSVPCNGFSTCEDACEAYNRATGASSCVGVSYSISNVFCYLKSVVHDCNVMPNSNVDSGLIV